ncbi:hypothetical protein PIB30_049872 [Stylosanthes scabra]|uniref:Uncharacterized protein n=1 Tax=Stylosanthes scabra TaxID=79078 RepID=A0ABU6UH90_9FABA|nr:hypothetical protein [Stylosanthes scabra]
MWMVVAKKNETMVVREEWDNDCSRPQKFQSWCPYFLKPPAPKPQPHPTFLSSTWFTVEVGSSRPLRYRRVKLRHTLFIGASKDLSVASSVCVSLDSSHSLACDHDHSVLPPLSRCCHNLFLNHIHHWFFSTSPSPHNRPIRSPATMTTTSYSHKVGSVIWEEESFTGGDVEIEDVEEARRTLQTSM